MHLKELDMEGVIAKLRRDISAAGEATLLFNGVSLESRRPSSKAAIHARDHQKVGVFYASSTDTDIINQCCQHIEKYRREQKEQGERLAVALGPLD